MTFLLMILMQVKPAEQPPINWPITNICTPTAELRCVPFVTPAIEEEYGGFGNEVCDLGNCTWVDAIPGTAAHRRKRWMCSDKRRVLVTTEAGTKLCVLFPEPRREGGL